MSMTTAHMQAEARRGVVLIILASVLWGTIGVAVRTLYEISDANPLSIGFFRLAIATPVLLLASWNAVRQRLFAIRRSDLGLMLGLGLAMALYQVSYFAAIAQVGVTIAVLVAICTAPIMVTLLAAVVLKEQLTRWVLLALGCAMGGVMHLVGGGTSEAALQPIAPLGVLLALGAGLSYAVVTLCSRALAGRYHPLQPISIGFGAGAVMLLPFALGTGLVVSYPLAGWALLLHLGLIPTALGYLLFLMGIRFTTATVASIGSLVEPLTTTTFAWVFFHERLDDHSIVGAGLLLAAMAILVWKPPQE